MPLVSTCLYVLRPPLAANRRQASIDTAPFRNALHPVVTIKAAPVFPPLPPFASLSKQGKPDRTSVSRVYLNRLEASSKNKFLIGFLIAR